MVDNNIHKTWLCLCFQYRDVDNLLFSFIHATKINPWNIAK
jgi:hypothetical protein